MDERAHTYVPMDRRHALVAGRTLPRGVHGTALETDLSGFTALTESLARQYGEQRGAEQLALRLNVLYDGLIREVHRYGGTVLGFAGDAFTSWLDGDDGARGVACAEALQRWMADHADEVADGVTPPRLKVALATGATRRFLVGDPDVQLLEGLAGSLVDELAAIEHEAEPGDVVLAASTRASLGGRVRTGERGVLLDSLGAVEAAPWPELAEDLEDLEPVRPWLLPSVFDRLAAGEGGFLAELRPATALFMRFGGIEFEADPAALDRLDELVRGVQAILRVYEGTLVQLTIGDKGSYLYAAFGAPVAHEDDSARALLAALDLIRLGDGDLIDSLSIGVAAGRLRAGAYGGSERRTYGVLGDTVNLSARLMQAAGPGQVIATQAVRDATAAGFAWDDLAAITVKGKSDPVAIARLTGLGAATPARHAPTRAAAPMLGRQVELDELTAALDEAIAGRGQVVAVTAEAGMGKTRLVTELRRQATDRRVAISLGECPSFGINGSYVVWRPIWQHLLGVDAAATADDVASSLGRGDPALLPRLPLLGPLLGVLIPDNELTGSFEGKVRKTSLEATLADWLRASTNRPRLLVLEDCHWIDPLSEDLLEVIGRVVRDLPVLVVVTHRTRGESEGGPLSVVRQPHYREVALGPLADDDVDRLVRSRLEPRSLPRAVTEVAAGLVSRAEGNPFYVEELLDHLLELGADALDPERVAEMPSSLQSLILSRIDRLAEQPRSTLKVASAVGRVFEAGLLSPVHHELGTDTDVDGHLDVLERADFVLAEHRHDRLFSFIHAVSQEVAYSTIAADTRASLHGRIGRELERRAGDETDRQLDLLAHHFSRGDDDTRRRTYVLRAGRAAQARFANQAAAQHFRNVLVLLADDERGEVLLELGRVLGLTGQWDDAATSFRAARDLAIEREDVVARAWAEIELGELDRKQGRYAEAEATFDRARERLVGVGDVAAVAEVLHLQGTLAAQQGDTELARARYERSLGIRRDLGDRRGMARCLNGLGITAEYENRLADAADLYQQSLVILGELGDRWGVAAVTNNAGYALLLEGRAAEAQPLFERAVALQREIGDPSMLANFLSNLGDAAQELDDPAAALHCYEESLALSRELGERWLIAYLLEDVAVLLAREGLDARAVGLAAAGARLRQAIGAPLPAESQRKLDERLAPARSRLDDSARAEAGALGAAWTDDEAIEHALFSGSSYAGN